MVEVSDWSMDTGGTLGSEVRQEVISDVLGALEDCSVVLNEETITDIAKGEVSL
jgi:hypothetical protein